MLSALKISRSSEIRVSLSWSASLYRPLELIKDAPLDTTEQLPRQFVTQIPGTRQLEKAGICCSAQLFLDVFTGQICVARSERKPGSMPLERGNPTALHIWMILRPFYGETQP